MNKGISIAIDGPVAAGKGTIAPVLASRLEGIYLDTGAMYRCIALYCIRNKVNLDDQNEIKKSLKDIETDIVRNRFFLNKEDVTDLIRTKDIDLAVPKVAGVAKVREVLIAEQKRIAQKTINSGISFVAEGRDIATEVIPNADFKIFLTADAKVRAMRRLKQKEVKQEAVDFAKILGEVIKRDKQDIEVNKTLVKNPKDFGYSILDNSEMSEEETVNFILQKVKNDKN